jgi:hypothetical protein
MQRLSTIQLAADRTVFGRDRTFAALVRTGLLATAFVVAAYLMISNTAWHKPGKFDPYFWRNIVRADEVIE